MDKIKVARELVKLAKELVGGDNIVEKIEKDMMEFVRNVLKKGKLLSKSERESKKTIAYMEFYIPYYNNYKALGLNFECNPSSVDEQSINDEDNIYEILTAIEKKFDMYIRDKDWKNKVVISWDENEEYGNGVVLEVFVKA